MTYLLDTDIFSIAVRDGSPVLRRRLEGLAIDALAVSVVTIGEIEFGRAKKPLPAVVIARIGDFCAAMRILLVDEAVARRYGPLRSHLHRLGTPIGPNEL